MNQLVRAWLLVLVVVTLALPAHADEMATLLDKGPLVRLESTSNGKFKQALAIADVDAPIGRVWAVLADLDSYRYFMPRVEKLDIKRDGADYLATFKLDTPLVSTSYTNRYTLDEARHVIDVRQVDGDLDGSFYKWRLVRVSPGKTRIYYSGVIKNFSGIAQRLEDDQQTITIGINVVSLLSAIKAVKSRAETLERQDKHVPATPTIERASGG